MINVQELLPLVRSTGWKAGEILRHHYTHNSNQDLSTEKKDKGPVTQADIEANHCILKELQTALAGKPFGYLSEETHQGTTPLPEEWVWIIDPLDGTRDFIDKTGEYAIHIALVYQGRPQLSVVVIPEWEKLYFATKNQGTFVETRDGKIQPVTVSSKQSIEQLSLVASRTHRDQTFQDLINHLPFQRKNYVGSVGCKIAHILEGQSDVYISLSGKSAPKDWDFCAPELILTEAGGCFTHFEGHDLQYNRGDVCQWGGIIASNGSCHEQLCHLSLQFLNS